MTRSSDAKPALVIGIPCYNESENIASLLMRYELLAQLHRDQFVVKVIVIDDASTDSTAEIVSTFQDRLDLTLVKHPENRGLRGGLETAFKEFVASTARAPRPLAFAIMDGDDSHNPFLLPRMLPFVLAGYDIVVGSRFRFGSRTVGVALWRQLLTLGMAVLFKCIRPVSGVLDYSSGYRLYSPRIVLKMHEQYGEHFLEEASFACMVELLLKCRAAGALCTEVPMILRYDLKKGESKMDFVRTIRGALKLIRLGVKKKA